MTPQIQNELNVHKILAVTSMLSNIEMVEREDQKKINEIISLIDKISWRLQVNNKKDDYKPNDLSNP